MKNIINSGLVLALLIIAGCTKYHRANYEYGNMAYYKAAANYTHYLDTHKKPKPQAVLRLAECYYKMHDYSNAEYWYGKAVVLPETKPAGYLEYAKVLKINGKYAEAKKWLAKYLEKDPDNTMALAQLASCDSIGTYYRNTEMYQVSLLNINNNINNFAMTPYDGGYVFCSEQSISQKSKTNPWNGHPYLSMLFTKALPDGKFSTPTPFSSLNCPYHNGPATFTSDNDRVYFSRSNYMDNKLLKNNDNVNNIKIYTAKRSGNKWTRIRELPFNSNNYSCGQPTLSSGDDTMYFASDKGGGYGNTDIYMSVNNNGKWSEPQNLGEQINTPGYEMFPYYYRGADGHAYLYFSSDGLPGLGGLDLFYSEQQPDGSWGAPVHMDAPINSSRDDFAINLSADGFSGYLSSSREDDKDKLFAFNKTPKFFVEGTVYNINTMVVVNDAQVMISNKTTGQNETITAKNGKFFLPLERNSDYDFKATAQGYLPLAAVAASTVGKNVSETLQVYLFMDTVCRRVLSSAKIYYDFDKWNIRPDAPMELDKVVAMLRQYPDIKLELDAHADSRGTQEYNMKLTQKRARSVVNYLAAKGIDPGRIYARWHGKLVPVNECVDGVVCTPAKHQQNRRAELKVINEACKTEEAAVELPLKENNEILSLYTIPFNSNRWKINTKATDQLDIIFEYLLYNTDATVDINSYTSMQGSDKYNMELSRKRAVSVANYLIARGISKDRINVQWSGKEQPENECVNGVICSLAKHDQKKQAKN